MTMISRLIGWFDEDQARINVVFSWLVVPVALYTSTEFLLQFAH